MSVKSVWFYGLNASIASSAFLINERWTIALVSPFFEQRDNSLYNYYALKEMVSYKLIDTDYLNLKEEKIIINIKDEKSEMLIQKQAKYVGMFRCDNIIKSFEKFSTTYSTDFLLGFFLVLDILNQPLDSDIALFLEAIKDIMQKLQSIRLCKGTEIFIESTPFGMYELMNSLSSGIISTFFGNNDSLFLTDAVIAPLAEGAPIYVLQNGSKMPIGVTLGIFKRWNYDSIGLTVCVKMTSLFNELLDKKFNLFHNPSIFGLDDIVSLNVVDNAVVQMFCGNYLSSAILIDQKKGIFITASHALRNASFEPIHIKLRKRKASCSLIYRTENLKVFDIAVIKCDDVDFLKSMIAVKFASEPVILGEDVIAAGYPLFKSDDVVLPLVTKGNVSLVNSCCFYTTCIVLAGSSGGGIFRKNGDLLGVVINHFEGINRVIYPKTNMIVPVSAIAQCLINYLQTDDVNQLHFLQSKNIDVLKNWCILSTKL